MTQPRNRPGEDGSTLGAFAVAVNVRGLLTYRIPAALSAGAIPGARAILPVGRSRRNGILIRVGVKPDLGEGRIRDVERFVGRGPVFTPSLIEAVLEGARYYRYPEGLALDAALPRGGDPRRSAGRFTVGPDGGRAIAGEIPAGEIERRTLALLAGGPKTLAQLSRHAPLLGREVIDGMIERGLVAIEEGPRAGARERTLHLARTPGEGDGPPGEAGARILEAIGMAPGVTVSALRRSLPFTDATLRALVRAGLVRVERGGGFRPIEEGTDRAGSAYAAAPARLTAHQIQAVATLDNAIALGGFRPFLLHGVTGSGKTEVYIRAIRTVLSRGRSAIVLVPEIALTPQLVAMFGARVGAGIAVLHSAMPPSRRRAEWESIASGGKRVVIGARSAVFAPARDPGIFVVDEEHDASFKQSEGWRYHARDLALLRARREGALAVLGSATPSVESYHNTLTGKIALLELPERATAQPLPEVEVVDLRFDRLGPASQPWISSRLYETMGETLAAGGQVILFLNRRGFAPSATCTSCGQPVRCPSCSVALVHHRFTNRLSCHYCGHSREVPGSCPSCAGPGEGIELKGPGTERIEQVVRDLFPRARTLRMDSDVASGSAAEPILGAMREGAADILVGTQMVTKGHDLPRVALVGVVRADMGLGMPDFRAAERTFQLITQVAGRAGRGDAPGRVVIQTYNPDHPCLASARDQDYASFYQWEIANRRAMGYPPFTSLALVRVSGADEVGTARAANDVAASLAGGDVRVLGPVPAPLARLRGRFRQQILLKAGSRKSLRDLLDSLPKEALATTSSVRIGVDVDPLDFL